MTQVADASFELHVIADGAIAEAAPGQSDYSPSPSAWTFDASVEGSRAGIAAIGAALLADNESIPYGRQLAFLSNGGTCSQVVHVPASTVLYVAGRVARCAALSTETEVEGYLAVNGVGAGQFHLFNANYHAFNIPLGLVAGDNIVTFGVNLPLAADLAMLVIDMDGPAGTWLEVAHATGAGKVRTSGNRTQLWAGATLCAEVPFDTMTGAPNLLMGKNPATGLPAYCPQPPQPASGSQPTPPVPVPPDPAPGGDDPCVQTRCGAALAMAQHLQDLYGRWQSLMNAALSAMAGAAVGILLDWLAALIEGLVVAERLASWMLTAFKKVRPALNGLSLAELGNVFPTWDTTTVTNVQRTFFAALQCQAGVVTVTAGDMTNVANYMRANAGSFLGDNVAGVLAVSCEFSALTDWQAIISAAPPSNVCSGF